ncbi:MAG: hypothetical protein VKJ86_04795 [Synechococcus sp.]|nr:hypothetical protein [Synechococcus sp.]
MVFHQWLDQIGDWNPQLFRELKGRLTKKNFGLVAIAAFLFQGMIYLSLRMSLPSPELTSTAPFTNHYCIGAAPASFGPDSYLFQNQNFCIADATGNFQLNWPLWWTDLFMTLSIMGFFASLLGGVYLIIQDLGKEEKAGTLNFVRLSPQSAQAIALGKILGVPSLIYGGLALVFPLHLWAGLQGGIPLLLILLFYGVVTASYGFFFSGAALYSLVNLAQPALKAWLAAGGLFYLMLGSTTFILQATNHLGNLIDGINLFNPLHMLTFLGQASAATDQLTMFNYDGLADVTFFRIPFWQNGAITGGIYFLLYGLGLYGCFLGFRRKFHSPNSTLLSKKQSYILTALLTLFGLGFTLQEPLSNVANHNDWLSNFLLLALAGSCYLFALMAALSPSFQAVQDWSRYERGTQQEWFTGERSPAMGAMMINISITMGAIALGVLFMVENPYKMLFALGVVMQALMVMLLCLLGQRLLLRKGKRQKLAATVVVGGSIVLPLIFLGVNGVDPQYQAAPWLWTIVPMVAAENASLPTIFLTILAQLGAIASLNHLLQRRIQQLGHSELQQILSPTKESISKTF